MSERPWTFTIKRDWVAHGLPCRIVQNDGLNVLLGYVRVGKDHPFYKVPLDKPIGLEGNLTRLNDHYESGDLGLHGMIQLLTGNAGEWLKTPDGYVKVHGSLGYAGCESPAHYKVDEDGWWFGWDAGHALDYTPFDLETKRILHSGRIARGVDDERERKWEVYLNRIEAGEIERDYSYEAELEGTHYWTVDEASRETERLAEQLSIIGLLGVKKKEEETNAE